MAASFNPTAFAPTTIEIDASPAIRPYSIAVAPRSSRSIRTTWWYMRVLPFARTLFPATVENLKTVFETRPLRVDSFPLGDRAQKPKRTKHLFG